MSVVVAHRPIAVDPDVFEAAPIGFEIAFLFLPKTTGHSDPRLLNDKLADLAGFYRIAVFVEDVDVHSGTRRGKRTRLLRQQRIAHQNPARDLGPPGVIDDRQFAIADLFE